MLWNRLDDAARCKGRDYIERTIRTARERKVEIQKAQPEAELDFHVERVQVQASDRSTYDLIIAGEEKVLRLRTSQLRLRSSFCERFLDLYHRIPRLPKESSAWADTVNGWLARAEVEELPDDASDEHALREAVQEAVLELVTGEEATDLDDGKALVEGEVKFFKTKAVLRALRDDWPDLKRHDLCRVLRALGLMYGSRRLAGTQTSVWGRP